MRYVCKVCGYIYDDEKEAIPFAQLEDSWVCPLCGAAKGDFEAEQQNVPKKTVHTEIKVDDEMLKLSVAQMAALCSNLAKGCEKQYKSREMEQFLELANYFETAAPSLPDQDVTNILDMMKDDLEKQYGTVTAVAGEYGDRGTLRVCTWGEKVTRMLNSLLTRYEKEGSSFLEDTEIWVCTTCGFVYVGERAPELCPVCKVPDWKFEKIEGRK